MSSGPLVVAYHGCDITTRDALITGRQQPKISANPYDWLGPGFYLFEGDPERALAFAQTAAENPEYRFTARPIVTPAVVGCVFAAHSCLDMTTRRGRAEYTVALRQLELAARTTGAKMPVNKPAFEGDTDVLLRGLDRAVINMIHANRPKEFQVVRGAFRQGVALSPGSGFHSNSHIQLALLDLDCVLGWFLPHGAVLFRHADLRRPVHRDAGISPVRGYGIGLPPIQLRVQRPQLCAHQLKRIAAQQKVCRGLRTINDGKHRPGGFARIT